MKNYKSLVMNRAFFIMRETGQNWRESLIKSWQIYRLNKELHRGEISFYFEKKNGEIRKARGTLKIDYQFKKEYQPNPKILTFFDLDLKDFRCLKVENFIMLAESKPADRKQTRQKRIINNHKFLKNELRRKEGQRSGRKLRERNARI